MPFRFSPLVAVAFALAGCGSGGADAVATTSTNSSSSSGMVAPGGGLSVAEAISTDAEPPLAVSGWVVGSGADVRLCSRRFDASPKKMLSTT